MYIKYVFKQKHVDWSADKNVVTRGSREPSPVFPHWNNDSVFVKIQCLWRLYKVLQITEADSIYKKVIYFGFQKSNLGDSI